MMMIQGVAQVKFTPQGRHDHRVASLVIVPAGAVE
jgi:hypothetical protein